MLLPEDSKNLTVREIFSSKVVHFYFLLTQSCNLKCPFCYQEQMPGAVRQKNFRQSGKELSFEMIEKAINFSLDNVPEERLKYVFYGGEPLLKFDLVKRVVQAYPQLRFVMVTNGTLITDEIRDFLIQNRNTLYTSISIANIKKTHPDWKERMKNALEVARVTKGDVHYVEENPEDIYETYLWLEKHDLGIIRLSIPRGKYFTKEQLDMFLEQYKKVADHVYFEKDFKQNKINFDRAFKCNIAKHHEKVPLDMMDGGMTYCGCGILYVAVDYQGNLWGCDWLYALNSYPLGNLDTGFNMDNLRLLKSYQKNPVDRLYIHCKEYQERGICTIPDKRLCPRAQCIAENLEVNNELEKPMISHCQANGVEYAVYDYIIRTCIEKGIRWDTQ